MQKSKIHNIQVLRAVAVLLVVMQHVTFAESRYGPSGALLPQNLTTLYVSGVDIFFVISGFVMVTVTRGAFRDLRGALGFLYNRVTRIYPVYWFYSLVVLAVYLYRPDMVNSSQGNRVNILHSFLLLPQDLLPLVMVGWTLVHEMYFYVVFFALLFFPAKRMGLLLAAWASLALAGYGLSLSHSAAYRLVTHPLTFEFIAGAAIAMLVFSGRRRGGLVAFAAGAVLLPAAAVAFHAFSPADAPEGFTRVALCGTPSALLVYGATAAELEGGLRLPRFLRRIGDASYSIYLSHVLVLSAAGRLLARAGMNGPVGNVTMIVLMLASIILLGMASYAYLERPLLSLARRYKGSLGLSGGPAREAA